MRPAKSLLVGLMLIGVGPSLAEEGVDLSYRFALRGERGSGPSGTVWLYHSSWYGLHRFRLATIERGRARIRLSEARLRADVQPHPNTEAYVIVLEFPGKRWYRTPDLEPSTLLSNLPTHLNALGTARTSPRGETALVLPAPMRRRITLQHEDGRPAANLEVPTSIYLYDRNHCRLHVGLDLGTYRTDHAGVFEVAALLVPLYLKAPVYEREGNGPAGPAYRARVGVKTGAEPNVVLRRAWDLPEEGLEIQVRTAEGSPVASATVNQAIRTAECGAWSGPVGATNAAGSPACASSPPPPSGSGWRRMVGSASCPPRSSENCSPGGGSGSNGKGRGTGGCRPPDHSRQRNRAALEARDRRPAVVRRPAV